LGFGLDCGFGLGLDCGFGFGLGLDCGFGFGLGAALRPSAAGKLTSTSAIIRPLKKLIRL